MKRFNRFNSYLACGMITLAATSLGCMAPDSYKNVPMDVSKLDRLMEVSLPANSDTSKGVLMEMPRLKARFCLQRAIENYGSANRNTALDVSMLVAAGLLGGTGSTLGATSAAWADGDTKKDLGVASVFSLAAGGAVLGLRTALNLNELSRTQRVAAARNVNTAIAILEKYALSDDPKSVGDDGFGACPDEDVNVANAFPGAGAATSIEQLINKNKETEKKASTEAATAKGAAKEASKTAETSKKKATELKTRVADLKTEVKSLQDPKVSAAQKANKTTELEQAEKDLERAEIHADKQEAEATKAQIDAAKAELAAAQAELTTARAVVLQAGASLRRAVFYLTTNDVEIARGALTDAISDVDKRRTRVAALQKHVDELLNNGANQEIGNNGPK